MYVRTQKYVDTYCIRLSNYITPQQSPSLPLLPEPMVKMWPSSSLQAPTSDAFLGTVALAPLPLPPLPRPPLLLFPPRPARPALVSRPMSSGILGFSFRGITTILFSYGLSVRTNFSTRTNFPLERYTSIVYFASSLVFGLDFPNRPKFPTNFFVSRRCFDDSSLFRRFHTPINWRACWRKALDLIPRPAFVR